MKKKLTLTIYLFVFAIISSAYADSTTYGKVLYRVNAGGPGQLSIDTSTVNWRIDNMTNPSPYLDTTAMGNKAFATLDSIPFHSSVPLSTPYMIFRSERGMDKWEVSALEWNFPVPAGQEVEVRLYFAEIYYDSITKRVFDIEVENNLVLNDYDIFADVGHDVGVMKSFIVTSDGNIDIDLKRVKQHPKINGIEIIEKNPFTIAGIFDRKSKNTVSAYPNPFKDQVSLDVNSSDISYMKIYDAYGKQLENVKEHSGNGDIKIDLSQYPVGIYFLQIASDNGNRSETIRLIKQ
jgi:hypothetical protein